MLPDLYEPECAHVILGTMMPFSALLSDVAPPSLAGESSGAWLSVDVSIDRIGLIETVPEMLMEHTRSFDLQVQKVYDVG